MCESTVYNTQGTKLMDDVIHIKINGEKIEMLDILNQGMTVEGKIVELDLEKHSIFIKLKINDQLKKKYSFNFLNFRINYIFLF